MNLSEHFTLEELTFSQTATRRGIDNRPPGIAIENLKRLCELLESVRDIFLAPVVISSGYRSQPLNAAIGGAISSQHCLGCAADFTIKGKSLDEAIQAIIDEEIPFDQLIKEFDSWIHISVPNSDGIEPRKQVLIIDKTGTKAWGAI